MSDSKKSEIGGTDRLDGNKLVVSYTDKTTLYLYNWAVGYRLSRDDDGRQRL